MLPLGTWPVMAGHGETADGDGEEELHAKSSSSLELSETRTHANEDRIEKRIEEHWV